MTIDLSREAETVRANGECIRGEGWLSHVAAPSQVAAYVAASERVETLSTPDIIDIVKQGLDDEVAKSNSTAVRDLARDVLLRRAQE